MAHTITDFYSAWWFLEGHPAFKKKAYEGEHGTFAAFQDALNIHVAKVDPKTNRIEDEGVRNTKTEVWLECGRWESVDDRKKIENVDYPKDFFGMFLHDYDLDCGADTFEKAIIKLARLVLKEYGDYEDEDL